MLADRFDRSLETGGGSAGGVSRIPEGELLACYVDPHASQPTI